jgi:TonB family protein
MDSELQPQRPLTRPNRIRRRAYVGFALFVVLSAAFHFLAGPTLTKLAPRWQYSDLPDQALSIVTLSHRDRQDLIPKPPPTPKPTPPPVVRTRRELALLQYKEMGQGQHSQPNVRPPARRVVKIVVDHPTPLRPAADTHSPALVAAMPEPTPQAPPNPGTSKTDTAGQSDQLSGTMVWGDDNPPRVIKRAALAIDDTASGTARVEVQVGPDGHVISVQLIASSGDAAVDNAALDAARNSTFAPATNNGIPVHGECVLEFAPSSTPTL